MVVRMYKYVMGKLIMMEKNMIYARIINMNIKVICLDAEVCEYIYRELELHICNENSEKQNLIIDVKNRKFEVNDSLIKLGEGVYTDNKKIYICIEAFLRKTWISVNIQCEDVFNVEVYIDKKNSRIKRLCAPNFQFPWQNSIIDFFHGIFLWILEVYMLSYDVTLIHAAAFIYEGRKILLAADAAMGKSTIVDAAVLQYKGKYIAEDYCFIDRVGNAYGLFNQRRIFSRREECNGIEDVCNYLFFTSLAGLKLVKSNSIRIRSTSEIYTKEEIVTQKCRCEGIYLVRNETNHKSINCAAQCAEVMTKEINNWDGCVQLMNALETVFPNSGIYKKFWNRLNDTIIKNISASNMKTISIPYRKTRESFLDDFFNEMERLNNENGN